MNKRLCQLLIASLIILIMLLSGCTPSNMPDSTDIGGQSLSVVTSFGPNDGGHEAFFALCDEFSASTGVILSNAASDSTEEWKKQVIDSFDGDTEPDVLFFFTGENAAKMIKDGKFVSIEEISQAYPDYASNINLAVLESMRAADGKGYAVPVKGYWERVFINKDIFDNLNLSPPKTYQELFALAPKLTEAGVIPIAASLQEVPHYLFEYLLFNETGPANHHNIPKDPDNIPEAWITALEQLCAMYDAGMFPEDGLAPTHADALELFQMKQAAMLVDGDWSVAHIRDSEHTEVVNFPSMPNSPRKATDLISEFSMGFYITAQAWENSEKRDAAVAFVQFISSNDSILRLNVSGAAMPISISQEDKQALPSALDKTPLQDSIDALNEETTAFVGAVSDKFNLNSRSWLFSQIQPLVHGETSSEEVLREFIILNNQ